MVTRCNRTTQTIVARNSVCCGTETFPMNIKRIFTYISCVHSSPAELIQHSCKTVRLWNLFPFADFDVIAVNLPNDYCLSAWQHIRVASDLMRMHIEIISYFGKCGKTHSARDMLNAIPSIWWLFVVEPRSVPCEKHESICHRKSYYYRQ